MKLSGPLPGLGLLNTTFRNNSWEVNVFIEKMFASHNTISLELKLMSDKGTFIIMHSPFTVIQSLHEKYPIYLYYNFLQEM